MNIHPKALHYLAAIVVAFGVVLRVLFLDADPQYYAWAGYITDEGRWIYQAREMFLFHTISRDYLYEIHLILAPLFQLVNYFIFNLVDPSIVSSRIFTAVSGGAILLLFWKHMYRYVTPQAMVVGLVLLAVQVDLVVLSRLAVPEIVTIVFQALVYFGLLAGEPSRQRMAMLGVLALMAVGMKGTIVFSLGIFSLMILLVPGTKGEIADGSMRWRNLLWFWGGFATPLLVTSLVWFGCCTPRSLPGFAELSDALHLTMFSEFVRFSDAYSIVSFFFKDPLTPALYLLAMGLWLSWLGWIAADREEVNAETRRYLVTSTIWIVAYLALMLTLEYFPRRYMVHIVLPMAINVTVGVSLLQKVGVHKVLSALQRRDRFRLPRLVIFVLPTAVFLAPLLLSSFAVGGINPDRFVSQLACVAISAVATTYVVGQFSNRENALKFFVVFPLIQMCAWGVLSDAYADAFLWSNSNGDFLRWPYLGSVAVATMATILVTVAQRSAVIAAPRLATIYTVGYFLVSTMQLAPAYLEPHFSIRDTSRELGVLLDGEPSIASFGAEGLFSENQLRYQQFHLVDAQDDPPEIVVSVFEDSQTISDFLKERYHVIRTRALDVSPRYAAQPDAFLPIMRVYKKIQ